MKRNFFEKLLHALLFISFLSCGVTAAGQWEPLCVKGIACGSDGADDPKGYYFPSHIKPAPPLIAGHYIWFHHGQIAPSTSLSTGAFRLDTLTGELVRKDIDRGGIYISDAFSVGLSNGNWLNFDFYEMRKISRDGELVNELYWSGHSLGSINAVGFMRPPVERKGVLYAGIQHIKYGEGTTIYHSVDNGHTWVPKQSDISLGSARYSLAVNPEKTGLWVIKFRVSDQPSSLWESLDDGETWRQVDNGSFPGDTHRIIHDPVNLQISYALTSEGLYISTNKGISWQQTSLGEAVHSLVFVRRMLLLSRALAVGTDSGVKVSIDEGVTWLEMSGGLIKIPHTLTYLNGVLIATSEAGYFTCNTVDCVGTAQKIPTVTVTEFYNTDLGHYFITPSEEEANGIDEGSAGPGWVRTGETFLAWSLLGDSTRARNVCRFYGSVNPGPNSHFFTQSSDECSALHHLEQVTPASEPRWNFEQYSFIADAPYWDWDAEQPCSEATQPVYQAYNGGFQRGEDSNHRYVVDPALLEPMVQEGWIDEGIVFCVPAQ